MRPIYDESGQSHRVKKGVTQHSVRTKIFRDRLCGSEQTPYLHIHTQLEQACIQEMGSIKALFRSKIEAIFNSMAGDYKRTEEICRHATDNDTREAREAQSVCLEAMKGVLFGLQQSMEKIEAGGN